MKLRNIASDTLISSSRREKSTMRVIINLQSPSVLLTKINGFRSDTTQKAILQDFLKRSFLHKQNRF